MGGSGSLPPRATLPCLLLPVDVAERSVSMLRELAQMVRGTLGRADRGLYGGKKVMSGNNVSFSKNRTKRKWKPNVQTKRLLSEQLDETIKLRVTTHALRCIDKAGGLDSYILNLKKVEPGTKEWDLKAKIRDAQQQ